MRFNADEYEEALRVMRERDRVGFTIPKSAVILEALRIASRVMRPGIIQKASEDYFAQCESFDYADEAEAICKALTE